MRLLLALNSLRLEKRYFEIGNSLSLDVVACDPTKSIDRSTPSVLVIETGNSLSKTIAICKKIRSHSVSHQPLILLVLRESDSPKVNNLCNTGANEIIFSSASPIQIRYRLQALEAQANLSETSNTMNDDRTIQTELQLLLNQLPAILWTTDKDLRFTSSQGAALAAINLKPNQVVGLSLYEFFKTDDKRDPSLAAHQRVLKGEVVSYEREWDGRYFQSRIEPLRDDVGQIIGCIGLSFDVTEQRKTERAIVDAAELERQRIGRELHDDLGQQIAGAYYMLHSSKPEHSEATRAAEILHDVHVKIQRLARGLWPAFLISGTVNDALTELRENIQELFKIECTFSWDRNPIDLNPSMVTHLYRIAQEAVTNAIRHGKAKHINLILKTENNEIELRIESDGLPVAKAFKKDQGLGVRSMQWRARAIDALLTISPNGKNGGWVSCQFRV